MVYARIDRVFFNILASRPLTSFVRCNCSFETSGTGAKMSERIFIFLCLRLEKKHIYIKKFHWK